MVYFFSNNKFINNLYLNKRKFVEFVAHEQTTAAAERKSNVLQHAVDDDEEEKVLIVDTNVPEEHSTLLAAPTVELKTDSGTDNENHLFSDAVVLHFFENTRKIVQLAHKQAVDEEVVPTQDIIENLLGSSETSVQQTTGEASQVQSTQAILEDLAEFANSERPRRIRTIREDPDFLSGEELARLRLPLKRTKN